MRPGPVRIDHFFLACCRARSSPLILLLLLISRFFFCGIYLLLFSRLRHSLILFLSLTIGTPTTVVLPPGLFFPKYFLSSSAFSQCGHLFVVKGVFQSLLSSHCFPRHGSSRHLSHGYSTQSHVGIMIFKFQHEFVNIPPVLHFFHCCQCSFAFMC